MVTIQKALEGFASFAAKDVIAAMPNGLEKFLALMAVGAMRNNPGALLRPYEPILKSMGVITQDGTQVDEQALASAMSDAFAAMPKFNWMGFTFTADDADKLLQRIAQ